MPKMRQLSKRSAMVLSVRTSGSGGLAAFASPRHFFAAAAEAMRRVLVDRARGRDRLKRGGGRRKVSLDALDVADMDGGPDMLALDEALARLEEIDARKHQVVMLRYFAGLTLEETAQALGVSLATVKNEWRFARAWLVKEL